MVVGFIDPKETKLLNNDRVLGPLRKKFLLMSQEAGKLSIIFGSLGKSEEAVQSYNNLMKTANEIIDMVKAQTEINKAWKAVKEARGE